MLTIHRIQIEPLCMYHSLPFTHICITKYCQCSIKLCEKCCTQHENQNQNSNILKIQNFQNKLETQVDILNKQQQKLNSSRINISDSFLGTKQKFQKFALGQVKVLEDSMKYLNEESSKVNRQIKDASEMLSSKMDNICLKRKDIPENYAKKIYHQNMLPNLILFYNQKGFERFRQKLQKMLQFRGMLKDFLAYADKFGKQYEQFMKCSSTTVSSELSMKGTIKQILPKVKDVKEKANTGDNFYPQTFQKLRINNLVAQKAEQNPTRQKRAKTIFGKDKF